MSEDRFSDLIQVANSFGANEEYSRAGGGNASVKDEGVLYIKPSGVPLATLTAEDLVPLRLDVLLDALHSDEEVDGDPVRVAAQRAQLGNWDRRPSVEILFHALIPEKLVLHTHPLVANSLSCNKNAAQLLEELLGDEAILVPYTDPGVPLARRVEEVRNAYQARTGKTAPGITVLENHGIIISGDTAAEIEERSARLTNAISVAIEAAEAAPESVPAADEELLGRVYTKFAPALRGLLGSEDRLAVVTSTTSDFARLVTASPAGEALATGGPLIPDQIVYAGSLPLVLNAEQISNADDVVVLATDSVAEYQAKNGRKPAIVVVPGVAVLAAGKDLAAARNALATYTDALRVARDANRLGEVKVLNEVERGFIENWEAESYRQKMLAGGAKGRLDGKVVVITGAAQGFY